MEDSVLDLKEQHTLVIITYLLYYQLYYTENQI